jgi:hypothetical protein
VKPEVAQKQREKEIIVDNGDEENGEEENGKDGENGDGKDGGDNGDGGKEIIIRRFHGSVELDAMRLGRDAGRIADEVISHLEGWLGQR